MPAISGIYDSDRIQPVARMKDNVSILSSGKYQHYMVDYVEPLAPSPAFILEAVSASGATTLAALATIQKRVETVLQLNDNEFLQVRFQPLDNIEVIIWEQGGQQKFASRNVQTRINRNTVTYDAYMAMSQFFILGRDRDAQIEIRNPMNYATPSGRIQFWGFRYILKPYNVAGASERSAIELGDEAKVRNFLGGQTLWIPAEGRAV